MTYILPNGMSETMSELCFRVGITRRKSIISDTGVICTVPMGFASLNNRNDRKEYVASPKNRICPGYGYLKIPSLQPLP